MPNKRPEHPQSGADSVRGYTRVDNFLLDIAFPLVAAKHPKYPAVLLAVIRKTVGWHKKSDWISLSQLQRGSGAGRKCVVDALRFWQGLGLMKVVSRQGPRNAVAYAYVDDFDSEAVISSLIKLVGAPKWFDRRAGIGSMTASELVCPSNTQKKGFTKETKKESKNARSYQSNSGTPEDTYRPKVIYA